MKKYYNYFKQLSTKSKIFNSLILLLNLSILALGFIFNINVILSFICIAIMVFHFIFATRQYNKKKYSKNDKKYYDYLDFLVQTPKNLWSILMIVAVSMTIGTVALVTKEEFDPQGWAYFAFGFNVCIAGLGIYRPYTIYKKLK